jgi:5-carboxymethyl-2-hydroxymuconate isomerase
MPHLVIEYSAEGHADDAGLDVVGLMQALHAAAASTGVMQAADIKIRATRYADYLVAGKRDGFCHLSVYLLAGRTPEQKVRLSETLRATMVPLLPETRSLSVDIRDMDPVAYKKRLNGD